MSTSISNHNYQPVYHTIKIQILRVEINHSLMIKEFSPYIMIRIGNEQKKTLTNFHRDPYNAIFNEVKIEIFIILIYFLRYLNLNKFQNEITYQFLYFIKIIFFFLTNMFEKFVFLN